MAEKQAKRNAKTLQELTIKDAFMFAAVMSDPKRCRKFLSIVLDMNVCEVTVITEKTLSYHPEYHGVRLDVLADEAICRETGEVVADGVHTIWLSTKGTSRQNIPTELVSFLEYVRDPLAPVNESADEFVRTIEEDVSAIKRNRDWEGKFMLLKEMMEDERNEGLERGTKRTLKALKLLKTGTSDEEIIDITDISEEDLRALKEMAFATV